MGRLIHRQLYKEMLAEFFGTFVLVVVVVGTAAQTSLSRGSHGSSLSNAFGSGIGVMMAVHVSGKTSGGHVNPVVSFAMACIGKFSWFKVPFYMLAQYCGAFFGAAVVYGVYIGALYDYNGNRHDLNTAAIWTSFPASFLSLGYSFLDSMASSALLLLMILALTDSKNMGFWSGFSPFFMGLLVTTIGLGFSWNASNPMNPARDVGPRLFLSISGWGSSVFSGPNYTWWWISIVASHLGALIGALVYEGVIECHHPTDENIEQKFPSNSEKLSTPIDGQLHEAELLIPSVTAATPPVGSLNYQTSSTTL